jgi:hypothetical protein
VNRAAGLLLVGFLTAGPAARAQEVREPAPPAQAPRLSITFAAHQPAVPDTPVVRAVHLLQDGVFDGALRNGFPVRYHFRLELWRKAFLFDHLRHDVEWDEVVRLDPLSGEYDLIRPGATVEHFTTVDKVSRALATPFTVDLLPPPGTGASYYYIATLDIESLSEGELEEVERWLRGDMGPAISPHGNLGDALASAARHLLVHFSGLPRRRLEARSATFEAGR